MTATPLAAAPVPVVAGLSERRAFCAAGYEPTLDEIVEVTFTVNPRVRRIATHAPDELPPDEFYKCDKSGGKLEATKARKGK